MQGLQRLQGLEPAAVGGFLLRTAAVVCLQSVLAPRLAWCLDASLVLLPMPDLVARYRVGLLRLCMAGWLRAGTHGSAAVAESRFLRLAGHGQPRGAGHVCLDMSLAWSWDCSRFRGRCSEGRHDHSNYHGGARGSHMLGMHRPRCTSQLTRSWHTAPQKLRGGGGAVQRRPTPSRKLPHRLRVLYQALASLGPPALAARACQQLRTRLPGRRRKRRRLRHNISESGAAPSPRLTF